MKISKQLIKKLDQMNVTDYQSFIELIVERINAEGVESEILSFQDDDNYTSETYFDYELGLSDFLSVVIKRKCVEGIYFESIKLQ